MRKLYRAFVLITAMPIILMTALKRGWSLNKTVRYFNDDCCDTIFCYYCFLGSLLFAITIVMIALSSEVR